MFDDPPNSALEIPENPRRGDAQHSKATLAEPRIARCIPVRPIAALVSFPVHLHNKPGGVAKEVSGIGTAWVLLAELEAVGAFAKFLPKQQLGKAHLLPKLPRPANRRLRSAEHHASPSRVSSRRSSRS